MTKLTANDLKNKGVKAIEAVLEHHNEAIILVRGHARFVVIHLEHYQHLRQCELEAALIQSRADVGAGRFVDEAAEQHVKKISN